MKYQNNPSSRRRRTEQAPLEAACFYTNDTGPAPGATHTRQARRGANTPHFDRSARLRRDNNVTTVEPTCQRCILWDPATRLRRERGRVSRNERGPRFGLPVGVSRVVPRAVITPGTVGHLRPDGSATIHGVDRTGCLLPANSHASVSHSGGAPNLPSDHPPHRQGVAHISARSNWSAGPSTMREETQALRFAVISRESSRVVAPRLRPLNMLWQTELPPDISQEMECT